NFRNWQSFGVMDPKETTFGHILGDAGYKTCISGKWQLYSYNPPNFWPEWRGKGMRPEQSGFDEYHLWHAEHTEDKGSRFPDPVILANGKYRTDTKGKYGPNLYTDPTLAAEAAVAAVEQGFTAVKFDPAGPYSVYDGRQPSLERLDLSERYTAAIREAVGNRADLLFGTHGQFTPSGALRLARRLEPYDPLWFEEPVPPDDVEGMAFVARGTSIPIATGERLTT
ncbi:MAG: hypothetical protein GY778_01885, partial [bacterium]|nr:hypothetical protein [bacterium]